MAYVTTTGRTASETSAANIHLSSPISLRPYTPTRLSSVRKTKRDERMTKTRESWETAEMKPKLFPCDQNLDGVDVM